MNAIYGIGLILLVSFLMSNNKKEIQLQTVFGSLSMVMFFTYIVLGTETGASVLIGMSQAVQSVISAGKDGINMVLSREGQPFVFAFDVLPQIICFSVITGVAAYYGILSFITNTIGYMLHKLLKITKTESVLISGNIFVGMTESPMLVKDKIQYMSNATIFMMMAGGMSTIAGSVIPAYNAMGAELQFLVLSCFMAPFTSILLCKIFHPTAGELDEVITESIEAEEKPTLLFVIQESAKRGGMMAVGIGAVLIGMITIVSFFSNGIEYIFEQFGYLGVTFDYILGYLFYPVAYVIGVSPQDVEVAAVMLGQKLAINEFVAFIKFSSVIDVITPHSKAVMTIALSSFACLSSIGILLAGIGILAPNKVKNLAKLGMRALMCAYLVGLLNASIVSLVLTLIK